MRLPERDDGNWLYGLSHRLRMLLNVVLGHAQLLGMNRSLDAAGRSEVLEIEQAARALVALADELSAASGPGAEAAPPPDSDTGGIGAPTGRRILVVDDHPVNRAVLREQLETFGCTVDMAADGREALALWRAGDYRLILADLKMPVMNGLQLVRAVRAGEAASGSRIPIIAVTAVAVSETYGDCLAAGMDDVLAKPIELEALGAVLRRWPVVPSQGSSPAPGGIASEQALAGLFITTARQDLADGRGLVRARAGRDLADILHKLKSASLSVGAVHFSALATNLERSVRGDQWFEAEGLFGELEKALADFAAVPVPAPATSGGEGSRGSMAPEAMRQAILHDKLEVRFQPRADAAGLRPVGVEVLARWRSGRPDRVPSENLTALAERYDLVGPWSEWLLTKTMLGGARLEEAGFPLTVAVNLSADWLAEPPQPGFILATLRAAGIPAGRVVLEIAEAGAITAVADALTGLQRLGLGLAIEGSALLGGSLETLQRLRFGCVKLGRAWRDARRDRLPALLERARALEITVVAEGVDTPGDLEWARTAGCGVIQGQMAGAAMPMEDLIRWLEARPVKPKFPG